MKKRKGKIIDRGFQLKTAFSVIGITSFAFLIMIFVLGFSAKRNFDDINTAVNQLNKSIETESDIVKSFIEYSRSVRHSSVILYTKKVLKDNNESIKRIEDQVSVLQNIIYKNFITISIVIAVVFLLNVLLFIYIIKLTHRISGPIYIINRCLRDMNEGKSPEFRALRKGDNFTQTYDLLRSLNKRMIQITEQRHEKPFSN
jgi:predicted PurR-regulated permease PerM